MNHYNKFLRKHAPLGDTKAFKDARFRRMWGSHIMIECGKTPAPWVKFWKEDDVDNNFMTLKTFRLKRYGKVDNQQPVLD